MSKAALSDDELLSAAGVRFPPGAKVTPMLRQWLEAKAKAPNAILLFRMGDFYELFSTDAEVASPVLDLTLTSRDKDKGDDALPMAGFPHHAAPQYIAKLIAAGYKVAVCDQLEDPALARGIVKRDLTRVVTPGMVLDDESLEAGANNFLVAVARGSAEGQAPFGVAALDLSTGTFVAAIAASENALVDEVARLAPREIVLEDGAGLSLELEERLMSAPGEGHRRVERRAHHKRDREVLAPLGALDRWFDEGERRPALVAAELAARYVAETQGALPPHLRAPRPYSVEQQLLLDATTRRHLDLTGPPGSRRQPGTLLAAIDRTRSAPGGRRLLALLLAPSCDLDVIAARHDVVEALLEEPGTRAKLREALAGFYDLERLTARVASSRAGPRDLGRMRSCLACLEPIKRILAASSAAPLLERAATLDTLAEVRERLDGALLEEQPLALGQGPLFRAEFDPALDELSTLASGGRDAIVSVEQREREATGIPSLKVRYTRVFGYYLEVTKTHLKKVPDHYRRKQTVANAERFVTEELSRLEEQVATAETRRAEREVELFEALRSEVAAHASRLLETAAQVADIDALAAFAEVSDEQRYVRPRLLPASERRLCIKEGRHPVVEAALAQRGERYVPSSIELSGEERQVLLVTGPNMAGKSTLMRQVALTQLLAQAGCFVPAAEATLSVCDRIFTRVGASDDLSQGRSTFMVEMTETAHIVRHATPESLVLLDEIGRGTSTFDGVSIAWAVAEHLHDQVGARTLFATHYHELCELADSLARVRNVHVVVKEWNDDIVFLRTLAEGGAERSYGIQVARLAGVPTPVLARAREVLAALEGDVAPRLGGDEATPNIPRGRARPSSRRPQMDLFRRAAAPGAEPPQAARDTEPSDDELEARLLSLDLNRMTPLDAMNALARLIEEARRSRRE